jgi:hypothetical protein
LTLLQDLLELIDRRGKLLRACGERNSTNQSTGKDEPKTEQKTIEEQPPPGTAWTGVHASILHRPLWRRQKYTLSLRHLARGRATVKTRIPRGNEPNKGRLSNVFEMFRTRTNFV